jgi:predicted DsbA family dithiol-disulfide isomerase
VEVLAHVAAQVGLDEAALRLELAAGTYAARREGAAEEARVLGITAVPTYLLADQRRVVGAQPLDYFRRLLASDGR